MQLLFPDGLMDIFEVTSYKKREEGYVFHLDEKANIPEGYERSEVESKGFYDAVNVSDFPLRGKKCLYKIRRRKWLIKQDGKIVSRKYKIVATGTRKTKEFAAFLKEINRFYAD